MTDQIRSAFAQLVGKRVLGGCQYCDAEQEMIEHAPGVYILRIYHDDWCPDHGIEAHEDRSN